ncbi:hypothetical protein SteCoe_24527 [Stentor coeruleus]|uniref:Protein kinase domain-containing protein n=1 Tax=Stentor coeruleus TaxID=5963 RepID=A0A1R2BHN6_9CILI|nr:hypothetical protein SteCoe_24527 [Stentor coeruleus]
MGSCISGKSNKRDSSQTLPLKPQKYLKFLDNSGILTNSYSMIKKIGEGATCQVKLATCKNTKIQRAVKSISISNEKLRIKAEREIEILKKIDHPCLVRSIESFKDPNNIHIVSEFYTGLSLYDMLKEGSGLNEKEALKYMFYIISGLNYLHKLGIMHRDLKPENMIFESVDSESLLKIIDFGSAQYLKKKVYKKKCGTILYMSPQVLEGKYTEKCDIWSIGIIFYIMISGTHPFYSDTEQDLLDKIRHLPIQFKSQKWANVSSETKHLISSMLAKKENERLSLENVRKALNYSLNIRDSEVINAYSTTIAFNTRSELHRSIVNVGLIKIVGSENVGKMFLHLDADGDGVVKVQDFLGSDPAKLKESSKSFREFEGDHLTFTEFLISFNDWSEIFGGNMLKSIFDVIDEDNDGMIAYGDLEKYSTRIHLLKNEMFKGEKQNGSVIKYEEFESAFHGFQGNLIIGLS